MKRNLKTYTAHIRPADLPHLGSYIQDAVISQPARRFKLLSICFEVCANYVDPVTTFEENPIDLVNNEWLTARLAVIPDVPTSLYGFDVPPPASVPNAPFEVFGMGEQKFNNLVIENGARLQATIMNYSPDLVRLRINIVAEIEIL